MYHWIFHISSRNESLKYFAKKQQKICSKLFPFAKFVFAKRCKISQKIFSSQNLSFWAKNEQGKDSHERLPRNKGRGLISVHFTEGFIFNYLFIIEDVDWQSSPSSPWSPQSSTFSPPPPSTFLSISPFSFKNRRLK